MTRLVGCGGGGGILGLLLVCVVLFQIPGCDLRVQYAGEALPGPEGATCDNVGIVYGDNPFAGWPLAGRGWSDINYYYCARDYYEEFGFTHWGIDIEASHREPLLATATATVAWAYHDQRGGMGKTVKLCTSSGWCAIYMHLDEWAVETGQTVAPGEPIGYADNTGFSTGTHLHYELRHPEGYPIDPAPTLGGLP